jgi:hypothetical protein
MQLPSIAVGRAGHMGQCSSAGPLLLLTQLHVSAPCVSCLYPITASNVCGFCLCLLYVTAVLSVLVRAGLPASRQGGVLCSGVQLSQQLTYRCECVWGGGGGVDADAEGSGRHLDGRVQVGLQQERMLWQQDRSEGANRHAGTGMRRERRGPTIQAAVHTMSMQYVCVL